jgi:TolB-like protein
VHPPIVERVLYEMMPALRREALQATAAAMAKRASVWPFGWRTPARRQRHQQSDGAERRSSIGRNWTLAAVALLAVVSAAGAVSLWRRPAAAPAARTASVAIFPFAVAGDARLGYLGAGMVDMLTTSLDGAAGLRTIDPRAVIAAIDRPTNAPALRVDEARALAERLGARYFVLGSVLGASDRLEVSANLYETSDADASIARASASGGADALFDIVDRVTAQLAVAHGARAGERLTQLAGVTTTSLPALKAYLEARSAYRDNDLYAALPAYQRAVAADSTFALAWYGLASTASWMLRPGVEQHAAAQAVRFGERLSPRERILFDAFASYSRGDADSAERIATTLAETYDDVEAWVLVGEVLYHHNWKRGRSATESRRAWERVLALDARYWPALQHLAEVAALEGNEAEADSLLARYERSVGAEHMMLASRALRAHAFGDERARQAIAPQLVADRGFWVILSVWYVGVAGRDVDAAQQLARLLVQPLRPPAQQGFGRVLLAHLALARGRWREAQAELAIARAHAPVDALQHQLMLALAPHVASSPAAISALSAELARQPAAVAEPASAVPWPRPPITLEPAVRAYLEGVASARTGDAAGRSRALARLASAAPGDWLGELQSGFASSIQAEHERVAGRPEAALLALERSARPSPFVAAWTSSFVAQAYERYQRAELLHQLKRDDEALRWYGTFGENSPYDLVYLAPALYRQAQILDGRGDRRRAAERYARFVELWKDCDPELQPFVVTARARLAQLR